MTDKPKFELEPKPKFELEPKVELDLSLQVGKYEVQKLLGKGATGTV
ncbi:MAG: hypothetical protein K0R61_3533, partial [Microvirga sp.]|nr:hypothetical protein [Microvirga sp.]